MEKLGSGEKSRDKGLKGRGILFLVAVILFVGNVASFFSEYGFSFTGSVIDTFTRDLTSFQFQSIAFVIQWGIIFGILIAASRKTSVEQKSTFKKPDPEPVKKAFTDIDVLYATLQKKGNLSISMIGTLFNIDKEHALEWAKILESHNLATLRHRAFTEPELVKKEEST